MSEYIPTADELTDREQSKLFRNGNRKRRCIVCGEIFTAKMPSHKYCSVPCRRRASRQRKIERALNGEFPKRATPLRVPRILILDRDNYKCIYCGRSPSTDDVVLEVDHIIPVTRGGNNTAGNLVTACQQCNQEKSSIVLDNLEEIKEEVSRRNQKHSHLTNKTLVGVGTVIRDEPGNGNR